MESLAASIQWVKGEIFEAYIFGSFGILLNVCAIIFWRFGSTPNAKAVVIPLIVVGLFFITAATVTIMENHKRYDQLLQVSADDLESFLLSEKKRVEDFQYLYKITTIIAVSSFTIASVFFIFFDSIWLRAIGIALIVFGLSGLVIDYFSKERSDIYYQALINQIGIQKAD